jgi:hypothetical protein
MPRENRCVRQLIYQIPLLRHTPKTLPIHGERTVSFSFV